MDTPPSEPETNAEQTKPWTRRSATGRAALFIITGIFLGVAGNAVWSEIAPPRGWSGRWFLTAITFGMKKMENVLIQEAARGLHEEASDSLLYMAVFLLLNGTIIGWLFLKWSVLGPPKPRVKPIVRTPAAQKRVLYGGLLLLGALFVAWIWNVQQRMYAHGLTAEFRQDVTILRPYLEPKQVLQLEADFAGMRNMQDFRKIADQLRDLAVTNHKEMPEGPY